MFQGRCKDFITTLHKQTGNERKKNAAALNIVKMKLTPNTKQVPTPTARNCITPTRHGMKTLVVRRLLISSSFRDPQGMSVEKGWNRKGIQVARPNGSSDAFKSLPFVPWGHKAKDLPEYTFTNSCPLDNTLMVLTYLLDTYSNIRAFVSRDDLPNPETAAAVVECVNLVGKFKFNHAKKHGMLNVAKYDKLVRAEQGRLSRKHVVFDMWYSESEMVGNALNDILRVFEEVSTCPDHTVTTQLATGQYWQKSTAKIVADMNGETKLRRCPREGCANQLVSQRLQYQTQDYPVPIVILSPTMDYDSCEHGTKFDDVPLPINVCHKVYKLAAASLFQKHPNHYFSVSMGRRVTSVQQLDK
ncbi:unnamed protein product [Allacma fusca]|uniref:Uncharacterized protein n=1 Tax=Allacma fusca TaxID=39272 RepID=A0A8J2KVA8_9HEXA|nr:unnamed protein product [Allacma fusca]